MTAISACRTCGTEPLENARFAMAAAPRVKDGDTRAEYKQVTVLFADVVHSMDIAALVGAERLREIMAELVGQCAAAGEAVRGHGGQVHRRRDHGALRRPRGLGGSRCSGLSGRLGDPAGIADRWPTRSGRDGIDLQATDRAEFRAGDRWGDRFRLFRVYRGW